ncbi:MAG: Gfo/Idh/MocA family oxidoreductase [Verrucomicrobiota bacterium]
MSEVRFGFIGAGKIAYHSAEDLLKHDNARLTAAQDLSEDRLNEFADKFEIGERYADSAALFASENVDAVYIAVPNKFHAELAIAALKAGKHVMLEKPFAMNATEAQTVIDAAKESGKLFTLGMNQRFREESQKIHSLAEKGAFGEIYYAKAYWFRRSGIPTLGTWFGNKALAGAGAINDIGVHLLDLCLHTIGNFEPVSVSGSTYTKFGNRGLGEGGWGLSDKSETIFDVDDLATAFIKMKNGATVLLEVTWACHTAEHNKMNVEIFGTDAGASLYPAKVYKSEDLSEDYQIIENVRADVPMEHASRFHNFLNAINGAEELLVKPEQALVVQKILDAVAESCATGKEVALD